MQSRQKDRRINGAALEMIMLDVLSGMQEFTRDTCSGCDTANMEIIAVQAAGTSAISSAQVLPFPTGRTHTYPD